MLRDRGPLPGAVVFARDPLWLGLPLFPRQELLLRLLYQPAGRWTKGLAADAARLIADPQPHAGVWLPPDWAGLPNARMRPGSPVTHCCFIMGRRSSKTTLAAIIEAYELVRMAREGRSGLPPGLLPGQEIAFLNCAASAEQATIHYRMLLAQLARLDVEPQEGSLDKGLTCLLPGHLRLMSLHTNARSVRGRTARLVVFDELAHFHQTAGPGSDSELYRALAPSIRTFGPQGKVLITSSPAAPSGVLWDLYQMRGQVPGLLVAQFATWEFNPHISRADLESEFLRHPGWAASEYGAQFPESSASAFLDRPAIEAAVTHPPQQPMAASREQVYFLHCDLGLVHDRTVIAWGHVGRDTPGKPVAVVDGLRAWQGSRAAPVRIQEIEDWLLAFSRTLRIGGISADSYESALLLERLAAHGLPVRQIAFSLQRKAQLYQRLEDWLRTGKLQLPEDAALIAELAALERTPGPGAPRYHAPAHGPVTTDDHADAVAGLLEWMAPLLEQPQAWPSARWVAGEWGR